MPIDFPNSPTVGQTFTVGNITYEWTGTVWKSITVLQTLPHASTHTDGGSDEVTIAQAQVTGLSTSLNAKLDKVNGAVTTADTSLSVVRNISVSTSTPTGGSDGDIWFVY